MLGHRALGTVGREPDGAAEEPAGPEPPRQHVRVGHRGQLTAQAVRRGAGHGAGALRAHLDEAARVHARDAAAAGADRVDIDHRLLHVVAAQPPHPPDRRLAAAHQRDVGAGPAHVERHDVGEAGQAGDPPGAHHAGGGTREQQRDRQRLGLGERHDATVGAHDLRCGGQRERLHAPREAANVAADHRAERRVERRRAPALELAELRHDIARERDVRARVLLADERAEPPLVHRVRIAVDKADGDRLRPLVAQAANGRARLGLVELRHHRPVRADALADLMAPRAGHQEGRFVDGEVVDVGADLPAELEDVPEALGGQQADGRAAVLQQRVRGDRRAVRQERDGRRRDPFPGQQALDPCRDAVRLVLRRRGALEDPQRAAPRLQEAEVREGAADVHAEPHTHQAVPVSRCAGRTSPGDRPPGGCRP